MYSSCHLRRRRQVENHGFTIPHAMQITGAPKGKDQYNKVWQKVQRRRERISRAASGKKPPQKIINASQQITPGTKTAAKSKQKREQKQNARAKGLDDAMACLPGWQDRGAIEAEMTRQKQRTPAQVNRDNFLTKAEVGYRGQRYANAYKVATAALKANQDAAGSGKGTGRGKGCRAVANKYNKELLPSPNDKQLNYETIRSAVANGDAGK